MVSKDRSIRKILLKVPAVKAAGTFVIPTGNADVKAALRP